MFENMTLLQLQQYWWIIISLLGGLLVFFMFVQGGQTLLWQLSHGKDEYKTMIANSLGRKWELGFTTLVTFGGAFFASFPLFYATSFGGAYWAWMAILFCFIIQAVSYEYRTKVDNFLGTRTYETFLFINGSLGVILLGIAVASFFSGSLFSIDSNNFSHWQSPWRGLELVFSLFNLSLGLTLFFLSRISGALYLINNIDDKFVRFRARKSIFANGAGFLFFFLAFVLQLLTKSGFAYDKNGKIFIEPYKYLHNFLDMPIVLIMFLLGAIFVVIPMYFALKSDRTKCIVPVGVGITLVATSLFLVAGFNQTAFYPSVYDLQSSLTIINASSSHYTLVAMSYASLMVPFVIIYIAYTWYSMDRVKITKKEMKESDEIY